jgi:hypothetical protein
MVKSRTAQGLDKCWEIVGAPHLDDLTVVDAEKVNLSPRRKVATEW